MADERLTDRTTLSELSDGDLIHVVDISDTTDNPLGTSKKGLWSLFKSTLLTYFNTQYLRSVTGDSVDNTDPLNPVVNAIPLSGTEVGSPVTGDVQFQNDTKLILNDVGGDIGFIQGRSDGIIEIGSDAYPVLISGDAGLNVTKVIQAEGGIQGAGTGNALRITGDDTGRGLVGIAYYGANYNDNTYVQKKYVDDNVLGTTNYISKFTGSNSIGNSQIYDNETNVGIGTTSPSYKLDVNGVIRGEQYLRLADTGGTNRFSIRAESTFGTIDNGSNTLNYKANNHLFLVGLSEKMRIDASGNVGIGTSSPDTKLEIREDVADTVVNSIKLTNAIFNTADTKGGVKITSEFVSGRIGSAIELGQDSDYRTDLKSDSNIKFYTAEDNSLSEKMVIKSTGNVGIGTTSPTAKLHVVGLPNYADNAAALAGGLTVGAFYHTAGLLKVVI